MNWRSPGSKLACGLVVATVCCALPGKVLAQNTAGLSAESTEVQQSKRASDNYDLRYAARPLTMPKGMIRGTFDVSGLRLTLLGVSQMSWTLNFGVAIAPVKHLEIGFSRYRMGSLASIRSTCSGWVVRG